VTRVDGADVYVKVPRLTYEFEHGPIPYEGSVPKVGDDTFVTFLEGNQDDVVGLFPGSLGRWEGPIQPTVFVAASDARPELRHASDYEATGTNDDAKFVLAIDAVLALGGGRVSLSDGNFYWGTRLNYSSVVTRNLTIEGAGQDLTTIWVDDLGLSGAQGAITMNLNGGHLVLRNLTIKGNDVGSFGYLLWLTGGGTVTLENVGLETTGTLAAALIFSLCDLALWNVTGTSALHGILTSKWTSIVRSTFLTSGGCVEYTQDKEGLLIADSFLTTLFGTGVFLNGEDTTTLVSTIEGNTIVAADEALFVGGRVNIIDNDLSGAGSFPVVRIKDATWVNVEDNHIHNTTDIPIHVEDCDLVTIRRNRIDNPTGVAIHAVSNTGLHTGLVIEDNLIDDTTSDAIFVDNYAHAVIGENQLTNGLGIGIHIKDTAVASVFSNKVAGADDTEPRRIYAENVDNLVLSDNWVSDKGWIEVFDCDSPVIVDNSIDTWDNATDSAAIVLSGTTDSPYVFRNIYEGASAGGSVVDYGLSIGASVTNVKHGRNDFRLATNWLKDQGTGTSERGLIYLPFADEADPIVAGPNSVPYQWIGNGEIVDVIVAIDTAPTGADLIVDVNVEGTSVWATQGAQPTIAAGSTKSVVTFPDASAVLVDGDIITVDIDQVGSATPGSNLTVLIRARETR